MFIFREPFWMLLLTGLVGLYIGYLKGAPRWGLLLGLLFGPIGWMVTLFLPVRTVRRRSEPPAGRACSRCGKTVGGSDKACSHCGNLLIPIRYRVTGPTLSD